MSEAYQAKKCGDEHHYVNQCQCRVEKLETENARLREALEKIAYHEGHMILDISRNKAVEGYRNNLHVAKQALKGRWK